jgi:hypothetical protein
MPVSRWQALFDAQAPCVGQGAPTQVNVVPNWFEELKQKVPTGKIESTGVGKSISPKANS